MYDTTTYVYQGRLGGFRQGWKDVLHMNLNKAVHPKLLRMVSAYLDQGISTWKFPFVEASLLENLRQLDLSTGGAIFGKRRAHHILHNQQTTLEDLLGLLVGDSRYFEAYLWDQQWEHPGWSAWWPPWNFSKAPFWIPEKFPCMIGFSWNVCWKLMPWTKNSRRVGSHYQTM